MAPYDKINNIQKDISMEHEKELDAQLKLPIEIGTDYNYKTQIYWPNVLGFLILHLGFLYGIYLVPSANLYTTLWAYGMAMASNFGVTCGAHRLWTHKTYKAKLPLKLALIVLQTISGQNCCYIWARDHRQHHKYNDTDADPHNSNRGFFFCHIGWLMCRKHPLVISKGKTIDMSDLEADRIVMFQKKYYKPLYWIFAVFLPVIVPIYFWNETIINSLCISYFLRYLAQLHGTWCVNSVAHFYGTKPFDNRLRAVESHFVGFLSVGEGWHNYHHAFPWDYRAAELGSKYNLSEKLIDLMAKIGWAYDLRTAPYNMIEYRSNKFGDGSHKVFGEKANLSNQRSYSDVKSKDLGANKRETIHQRSAVRA